MAVPKHIQEKLNAIADVYAHQLYAKAAVALQRYDRTGATADSLKVTWLKSSDTHPPRILLIFEKQAALFEIKKMSWVRVPNLDKLSEWANSVDFNGTVPGYKDGKAPNLPPWKIKQRIISAIAFDKRLNDKWKRKPWKGKGGMDIGQIIRSLNDETLKAWVQEVKTVLVESITQSQ